MWKSIKFLLARLFLFFLYRLIRAYSLTFRFSVENEEAWMDHLRGGGKVLICTWHQQFFAAIRHFRTPRSYQPALMISKSRDGDVIAAVARRSGWYPVRGSSSREGEKALALMAERLRLTRLAGHVVDGPRGPAGRVKPGLIRLARAADAVIVPFSVSRGPGVAYEELGPVHDPQAVFPGAAPLRPDDPAGTRGNRRTDRSPAPARGSPDAARPDSVKPPGSPEERSPQG